jgi:enamine deaminase RidA (YjgF/YER057c/UK114 family)
MSVQRLHVTSRYCEVAISGNLVHLAGQLADDTSVDVTAQTQQTLDNIDRLLAKQEQIKPIFCQCLFFLKTSRKIMPR